MKWQDVAINNQSLILGSGDYAKNFNKHNNSDDSPFNNPKLLGIKDVFLDYIANIKSSDFVDIEISNLDSYTKDVLEEIKYKNRWNNLFARLNYLSSKDGYKGVFTFFSDYTKEVTIQIWNIIWKSSQHIDNKLVYITGFTDPQFNPESNGYSSMYMDLRWDNENQEVVGNTKMVYWNKNASKEIPYETSQPKEWRIKGLSEIPMFIYPNNISYRPDGALLDGFFDAMEHAHFQAWNELDFAGAGLDIVNSAQVDSEYLGLVEKMIRNKKYTDSSEIEGVSQIVASNERQPVYFNPNQVDKDLKGFDFYSALVKYFIGLENSNNKSSAQETDFQIDKNNINVKKLRKIEAYIKKEALSRIFKSLLEWQKISKNDIKINIPTWIKVEIKQEDDNNIDKNDSLESDTLNNGSK